MREFGHYLQDYGDIEALVSKFESRLTTVETAAKENLKKLLVDVPDYEFTGKHNVLVFLIRFNLDFSLKSSVCSSDCFKIMYSPLAW